MRGINKNTYPGHTIGYTIDILNVGHFVVVIMLTKAVENNTRWSQLPAMIIITRQT